MKIRKETTTADWIGIDFAKQEDKSAVRMYCPICNHTLNFQISRD
jgi:hypothetical protein